MATQIEFRTGIRDPLAYGLRWLHVAHARGARVRVTGPKADLDRLSSQLWIHDKEGFVPHALAGSGGFAAGLERTPIWLGEGAIAGQEPPLLLNLGGAIAPEPQGYERIIEVVASQAELAQAGRERWAAYKRLGLEPAHHRGDAQADSAPLDD